MSELWQVIGYFDHRILISAGLGALIGFERELAGKDPSFRTFSLICLGSCIFSIISNSLTHPATFVDPTGQTHYISDPGRIAAQIVVGIGFLGAGVIYRSRTRVQGLTTAALMWVTAGIGMAVGFDKITLAVTGTVTSLVVLVLLTGLHKILYYLKYRKQESVDSME